LKQKTKLERMNDRTSKTMKFLKPALYVGAFFVLAFFVFAKSGPFQTHSASAATKIFLQDAGSDLDPGTDDEHALTLSQGAAAVTYTKNTVAGTVTPPTAATQFTKTAGGAVATWYSAPLTGVTISGAISFNLWANESAVAANATVTAELYRADGKGNIISTITPATQSRAELGTTAGGIVQTWSPTVTSTTLSNGDRLAIRVYIDDGSGVTMASGQTVSLYVGGLTAASGDSYVSVTESVTQLSACTATATGTWDGTANVSHGTATFTGCGGANNTPSTSDWLTINSGVVLTMSGSATVKAITINNAAASNGIIINNGFTLTVTDNLGFANQSTAGFTQTVTLGSGASGAGNLTVGSLSMRGSTCGASTCTQKIVCFGSTSQTGTLTISGAGTIGMNGSSTASDTAVTGIDLSSGACNLTTGTGAINIVGGSVGAALIKWQVSGATPAATFTLNGSLAFSGTAAQAQVATAATGAVLALSNGTFGSGGTVTGLTATLSVTSTGTSAINQTLGTTTSTLTVNGGTLTLGASTTWTAVTVASGAIVDPGTTTTTDSGNLTLTGTANFGNAKACLLTISGASSAISGSGSVTCTSTIQTTGATPNFAQNSNVTFASLNVPSGAALSVTNGSGSPGTVCGTDKTCVTITNNVSIGSSTTAASITLAGASASLSIGGTLGVTEPTAAVTNAMNVNAGTLTVTGDHNSWRQHKHCSFIIENCADNRNCNSRRLNF
jgi:hypothetical protein